MFARVLPHLVDVALVFAVASFVMVKVHAEFDNIYDKMIHFTVYFTTFITA